MERFRSIPSRDLIRLGVVLWILFSLSLGFLSHSSTLIAERMSYAQQYTSLSCSATSIMMVSTVPCLSLDSTSTSTHTMLPPADDDPVPPRVFTQQREYNSGQIITPAIVTAAEMAVSSPPPTVRNICWLFHWQISTGMPLNTPLVYIAAWQPVNSLVVQNNITWVDQYGKQWMEDHTNVTCWVQFSSPLLPMVVFDPPHQSSRATIGTMVMSLFGIVTVAVILLIFLYSKYVYSPSYLSL